MDKIKLALVGCGGMGTRHLYGLSELYKTPFNNIELVALCDLNRDNAELAAGEVETLLGFRPQVFTDMETMVRDIPDLAAVDVVTDPSVHHIVVCQALDLGLHVLVEKPMAITVRGCHLMMEAAQRNNRILSVAENYRRDPSARLVHHLLDRGAIGTPYMATFHSQRDGNSIFITPWRHLKDRGGPLLDLGVHFTDLIRYQLGDVAEIYGDARLIEPVRIKPRAIGDQYTFYKQRHQSMDQEVPATAEDSSMAMFKMESGVTLSWIVGLGGHGRLGSQLIMGDKGCLTSYGTRGGRAKLKREGEEEMDHGAILDTVGDFELAPLEAHFFPDKVSGKNVDWKIIAMEQYELAQAILDGGEIEVDGQEGMKDVAVVYAICESARAGRAVKLSEIESCEVYDYQAEIDNALGIG